MSLRGDTGEVVTRYIVNDQMLRDIRESEQFSVFTGATSVAVPCNITATFDFLVVSAATTFVAPRHQPEMLVVDPDWVRFRWLVREWHAERGTTSSPIDMAICPAYQRILAMGKPAIPLIFKQLELEGDDPDHWFWALSYLTGEDPVPSEDQGNMRKMRAAWLHWGRNNLLVR
jgi:hypothetical protein